jgi:hypothetical protein
MELADLVAHLESFGHQAIGGQVIGHDHAHA